MEKDIRSIMELLQKGVITPEEAEVMIKAINTKESFADTATKHLKGVGGQIGEVIDEVTPKVRSIFKKCFQETADFSQKMASKFEEEQAYEDDMFEEDIKEDFSAEWDLDDNSTSEEIIDIVTNKSDIQE